MALNALEMGSVLSKHPKYRDSNLLVKYFQMRGEIFIDKLGWTLRRSTDFDIEFEQYDTYAAYHLIAFRDLPKMDIEIVGGARLMPTTHRCGEGSVYSYMLRDAYLGLLEGMPAREEICFLEPPVNDEVWEISRLLGKPGHDLGLLIVKAASDFVFSRGGRRCLGITRLPIVRLMRRLSNSHELIGPITGNESGKFVAFAASIDQYEGGNYVNF